MAAVMESCLDHFALNGYICIAQEQATDSTLPPAAKGDERRMGLDVAGSYVNFHPPNGGVYGELS
jgi:hypothetical protein